MAEIMNGRAYRDDISPEQREVAKAENLVIITGSSDDIISLDGAIYDEVGAWEEAIFNLDSEGNILEDWDNFDNDIENAGIERSTKSVLKSLYKAHVKEHGITVKGNFDKEGYSWYIDLVEPKEGLDFAYFELFEDGEKHTRGVVLKLKK